MKRLPKIYSSQAEALKASKRLKGKYEIKPTKKFFLGYQLVRRK